MKETCPGDGSSSSDIVEKCESLKVRHQALIVARIAHHCKDNPASGEATQCDKDIIMGLNDCGKNTMCILEIVSNSLSCNNTEVRCSTLARGLAVRGTKNLGLKLRCWAPMLDVLSPTSLTERLFWCLVSWPSLRSLEPQPTACVTSFQTNSRVSPALPTCLTGGLRSVS